MQCACWESCAGDLFHAHMHAWVRILHMYRAFDVSPWRHVSGVHSDIEEERGKPQLNSRQSEGVTAILSRAGAIKGYSGLLVKMHISLKAFSVRACKRTHLAMRGWLHSTEWCRAFLWRFEWIFKSLLRQIHTEWTNSLANGKSASHLSIQWDMKPIILCIWHTEL